MKQELKLLIIVVSVFLLGYFFEQAINASGISNSVENTVELFSELFSVFVAFSIFAITWHAYNNSKDNHSLFLGSAFLVVGLLCLFHTLSYPFMPEFITPNSSHKAAIFFIESRLILALSFLISVDIYKDTFPGLINRRVLIFSAIALSLISLAFIILYQDNLFAGYEPGNGYSPEMVFISGMIIVIILYTGYLYNKRIRETGQNNLTLLIDGSIVVALSNLVYFSYGFSGHFLIITGFLLMYIALYKSSVELPYEKLSIAEEKLYHAAEDRYRNLFDNASDAIITIDLDENITSWNNAAEKIFGWAAQEAIGKKLSNLIFPASEENKKNTIIRCIKAGEAILGFDAVTLRKDGREVYMSMTVSPLRDANQKVIGMAGIMRDVTERRLTEEKLAQSEEKYRNLIDNIQDGVFIVQDAKIQLANEAFAKIGGYTVNEVIGKDFRDFVAPEDLEMVENNYARRLAGGNVPKEYEFRIRHRDGKTGVIVNMNVGLIGYRDRMAIMGTLKDITERKKAEDVRIENVRLTLANKAKSEFLATMSHELRTPLNSIIGFSELLKQGAHGALNEKQEHYANNVLTSGKHLLNLIDDILDISKVEAGKMDIFIEKMSVPETINETLELVKEKASKQSVVVKKEFDPELDFIEADRQKFKQILFNLLNNAVKFSKNDGGTVTVTTKKDGDKARFSISDTGIGIKDEHIERLFKTFEQLDSGISRNYGGTGLGLAISKKLVELHGGEIWVESRYGEGTTVTFLLPVASKADETKLTIAG